ncbi:MAG: class I SAM-dependent rRNA methyltransferase [Saprospiraceae bacterium]
MREIFLKSKKEEAVKRKHPWIFSGAIQHLKEPIEDGTLVSVKDYKGNFLAIGHWQNGSIAVRIIAHEETTIDQDFWNNKFKTAFALRQKLGFENNETTNCFRLIHAEGDGLPGLIVDVYGKTAVIQCHSIGMYNNLPQISKAIENVLGDRVDTIYNKSKETLPGRFGQQADDTWIKGNQPEGLVKENGNIFKVNWETGQKTGFFLDQRDNRKLLADFSKDKEVLNAFCYSGGFSVYALKAGASRVDSVDVSQKAVDLATENVALNGDFSDRHQSICADVLKYLKDCPEYDTMIVDPPAFAKSLSKKHNAVQGYKRLNAMALQKVKPGGIMFTFSCSQVIDRPLFYNTIVAAAIESGRDVRVLAHLSQPADHLVSLFHPEGSYLKGLVLEVL